MDLLGSKLLHEKHSDVVKFLERPAFAVGGAYNYSPEDRTSRIVAGSPQQSQVTILPKCIVPANPKQHTHVVISTPDGLYVLGHNPWNGQSMSDLSGIWWKMLVHREDPLYWNISHQLDVMACLDSYGVSTPFTLAPTDIKAMLAFFTSGKEHTTDTGTQIPTNEPDRQSAIPEVKITRKASTQSESNYLNFKSSDYKTLDFKDGVTQVLTDDLPSTGVHHVADAEIQTETMGGFVEENSVNESPVHRSDEKPSITISIKSRKYSINVTVSDDNPSYSPFIADIAKRNKEDQHFSITGLNARIITDIISRTTGYTQQSSADTSTSAMASVISDHSQKSGQNSRNWTDGSSYEQSASPKSVLSFVEGNPGVSSEESIRVNSCKACLDECPIATSSEMLDLSSDSSSPFYDEDDNLSSATDEDQLNSPLPDLSTQEIVPKTYRFLSAEVFRSLQTSSVGHNITRVSPFLVAGFKNQEMVPWSLVGVDVPFLDQQDVEPLFDKDQRYLTVGRGSYGYVRLGRYLSGNQETLAIKDFHTHQSISLVMDEAKLLLYLSQTGYVPTCYGVFRVPADPLSLSIVMEYFGSGRTLRNWIDDRPSNITNRTWITICRQLFCGLQEIHKAHVLMNDIKSNNVLLEMDDTRPTVKYIDFGLATYRCGMHYKSSGISKAEFKFLAPEVCEGAYTTVASDIYSAGYMLEEMCYDIGLPCLKDLSYSTKHTNPLRRPSATEVIYILDKISSGSRKTKGQHQSSTIRNNTGKPEKMSFDINGELVWWSARSTSALCRSVLYNSVDSSLPWKKATANPGMLYRKDPIWNQAEGRSSPFALCGYSENSEIMKSFSEISLSILDRDQIRFAENREVTRIVVGKGSFATVYLANLEGRDKAVVVKDFDLDQSTERDIEREAAILQHLQGTGAVPILYGCVPGDLGQDDLNIVQECIGNGSTLRHYLSQPPAHISLLGWLEIAAQMTLRLSKIHEKRVLVNDVKADNILIDDSADRLTVKFVDFGLATFREPHRYHQDPEYLQAFTYLAPEVRNGHYTSPLSDIYSLGYMLQYMAQKKNINGLSKIAEICLKESPAERPLTKTVYHLICGLMELYKL